MQLLPGRFYSKFCFTYDMTEGNCDETLLVFYFWQWIKLLLGFNKVDFFLWMDWTLKIQSKINTLISRWKHRVSTLTLEGLRRYDIVLAMDIKSPDRLFFPLLRWKNSSSCNFAFGFLFLHNLHLPLNQFLHKLLHCIMHSVTKWLKLWYNLQLRRHIYAESRFKDH